MKEQNYIFNLETTKIELHFEKSEYDTLSDAQKKLLKSNFLWSRMGHCWVSRCKEPNLYRAKKAARELGFDEETRKGERLSYAGQLERKTERAENRAERYETYSKNADRRAERLQKPLSDMHGDIAFFTQPNINSSAGRAFTNYRNRLYSQYEKGFSEYRKSEYFLTKADTARDTASGVEFKNKGYLDRRINECKKEIRNRQKNIVRYEGTLNALENGGQKNKHNGDPFTIAEVTSWIERELELIEVAMDKEAYLLNCLDDLGGIAFNKDNIEIGYIVTVERWGVVEVIGKGSKNISFKILTGGAAGDTLTAAYAEIGKIIKSEKRVEKHPFELGERFTARRVTYPRDSFKLTITAIEYEIVKKSDTTIQLKETGTDAKPLTRKPARCWNGDWRFSIDDKSGNTFYKKSAE
jgi:hypothetical protein